MAATEVVELPVLVGSGGFKGPPHAGAVEIGYSVLPQYQGKGYATEMVAGLVRRALKHAEVDRIVAETEWRGSNGGPCLISVFANGVSRPTGACTEM
ncbi:MAG: hypothetical protein C4310_08775 [Chloroflexota bacterium]